MRGLELQNQRTAQIAQITFDEIHRKFSLSGIRFLVLKGIVFAHEVYSHPAVRPFNDIDILVPQRELVQAEKVLTALGYTFYSPPFHHGNKIPLGFRLRNLKGKTLPESVTRNLNETHYQFVVPPGDPRPHVELHRRLFNPCYFDQNTDFFWEHTRNVRVGHLSVEAFNPELATLYLCIKISLEGRIHLLSSSDLIRYIRVLGHDGEEKVYRIAEENRCLEFLGFAVKLVEKIFPGEDLTRFSAKIGHLSFQKRLVEHFWHRFVKFSLPTQTPPGRKFIWSLDHPATHWLWLAASRGSFFQGAIQLAKQARNTLKIRSFIKNELRNLS